MNKDLLAEIVQEERVALSGLRQKAADKSRDPKGTVCDLLAGSLRFIGVAEFVLDTSAKSFFENLKESARFRLSLFLRYESGEQIAGSFVSNRSFTSLLDALACGDFDCASRFAHQLGNKPAIEAEFDRAFDSSFGYALKYLVLKDYKVAAVHMGNLAAECSKKEFANFSGYPALMDALLTGNEVAIRQSFNEILTGHRKLIKGSGQFKNTPDEYLCVWGIGLARLCRELGYKLKVDDPLIPAALILAE